MAKKILVLNPRPKAQARSWNQIIEGAGLKALSIPLVESRALNNNGLHHLNKDVYNGLFFSSPSGLSLFDAKDNSKQFEGLPVFTLSQIVWKKLASHNLTPGFCSKESSVMGFLREYVSEGNEYWLHPCSVKTRLNPEAFLRRNIKVENIPVYEPLMPAESGVRLETYFKSLNVILYSSGSTVDNLWEWLSGKFPGEAGKLLGQKHNIALGESSREALIHYGLAPGQNYNMGDLEKALHDYLNLAVEKS